MKNKFEKFVEIIVTGKDIYPENLGIRNLFRILNSIDRLISSIAKREQPDMDSELHLSLTGINNGSVAISIQSIGNEELFISTYKVFIESIASNTLSLLPEDAIREVKHLSDFTKETGLTLMFPFFGGDGDNTIMINPDTELFIPEADYMKGETTIYAKIERVGGIKKPKVTIRLIQGRSIDCDVEDIQLVKNLAHKLYEWVSLKGTALWNVNNLSIIDFKIHQIAGYRETSISQAVEYLSDVIGIDYRHLDDVVNHIYDGRKEELV